MSENVGADFFDNIVAALNARDPYGKAVEVTEFRITKEHLALVHRMFFDWDDNAYDGAPAVGIKRPYGNSDVIGDVLEIVGHVNGMTDLDIQDKAVFDREGDLRYIDLPDGRRVTVDDLKRLHRETELVLQIGTFLLKFEEGLYRRPVAYDHQRWEKVSD